MQEAHGLAIPSTLEDVVDPNKIALVVYDVQVGIRSQIGDGDRIVARVDCVLTAARAAGVRTFFTRHMSLPVELMGVMQYRTAMAWQRTSDLGAVKPWFLRDSPGFAIVDELKPTAAEAIFDKITMSAFEGTPLEIALRDCGIVAVILAGIALEVGIEPTARHAADLGFIPVVVEDACGHGNAAAAARSIEALRFSGDAIITDVETLCGLLDKAPRRSPKKG